MSESDKKYDYSAQLSDILCNFKWGRWPEGRKNFSFLAVLALIALYSNTRPEGNSSKRQWIECVRSRRIFPALLLTLQWSTQQSGLSFVAFWGLIWQVIDEQILYIIYCFTVMPDNFAIRCDVQNDKCFTCSHRNKIYCKKLTHFE